MRAFAACDRGLRVLSPGANTNRGRSNGAIAELLQALKSDDLSRVGVQCAVELRATEAIPLLQRRYDALHADLAATSEDDLLQEIDKENIAVALLRLGAPDRGYWNFLAARAQLAVVRNFPRGYRYSDKSPGGDGTSPEFLAWAKVEGVSPEQADLDAFYGDPSSMMLVAETKDSRALPLLREGLRSRNPIVQIVAADGLADMRDKASLPLLIAAANRQDDAQLEIVEALAYFDDPEAQRLAKAQIPPAILKETEERRARGCTPNTCWMSSCVNIPKVSTGETKPTVSLPQR